MQVYDVFVIWFFMSLVHCDSQVWTYVKKLWCGDLGGYLFLSAICSDVTKLVQFTLPSANFNFQIHLNANADAAL